MRRKPHAKILNFIVDRSCTNYKQINNNIDSKSVYHVWVIVDLTGLYLRDRIARSDTSNII